MMNFIEMARAEASASTFKRARLGAVVLDRGMVAGRGRNSTDVHPAIVRYGHYAVHAECAAMLDAARGDTIVVVRVSAAGNLTCAKPCHKCLAFAADYGIKRIIYTTWDGTTEEIQL